MQNNTLKVSVVVISYNSAETIVDTLDSILNQSYGSRNIELLICDDCSPDNTVQVAEQWIAKNISNFFKIEIIKSTKNKGVAINIDRGWRMASTPWVKSIAADDILMKDCLADNIAFIRDNPSAEIVFSDVCVFADASKIDSSQLKKHDANFFKLTAQQQLDYLYFDNALIAPTSFISKNLLEKVGYADERYPMLDDYPLWLKISKAGVLLNYLPKVTVAYRFAESVSNNQSKIANLAYIKSLYYFRKNNAWSEWSFLDILRKYDEFFYFHESVILISLLNNKRTTGYRFIHYAFFLLRPYAVYKFIQRLVRDFK